MMNSALIVGASGGIGSHLATKLAEREDIERVYVTSRSGLTPKHHKMVPLALDLTCETSIEQAIQACCANGAPTIAIVATGVLHDETLMPEKTWRSLNAHDLLHAYHINCVGPALVAKHLFAHFRQDNRHVFAALSARVGSIGDNRLGGWHAYRSSKAALNMMLKNLAIELARRHPLSLCIGLHPGTVDTELSKPFQANVPSGSLHSPELAAAQLLSVIDATSPSESGSVLAWDGTIIEA